MEDKAYIKLLFKKYLDNQLTAEEMAALLGYFQLPDNDDTLHQLILAELAEPVLLDKDVQAIGDAIASKLFKQTKPRPKFYLKSWFPYAAALLILALAIGLYRFKDGFAVLTEELALSQHTIQPGGNRATISLDNGRVLTLREDQAGIISKGGRLLYTDGSQVIEQAYSGEIKLLTPRAGQYRVQLQDGTRVWLNAASALRFPLSFDANQRNVTIDGEAYFEVAHRKQQPFLVHTGKQDIQVLGTSFNVYAYAEDTLQHTTLVSGAVQVRLKDSPATFQLSPGEQAVSDAKAQTSIREVDPAEYVSWKDGIITLNSYALPEILGQLERWYDVEFSEVPADVKTERVFGMIQRDVPLNDLLKTLTDNYSTIKFKINGRRIMISKR